MSEVISYDSKGYNSKEERQVLESGIEGWLLKLQK